LFPEPVEGGAPFDKLREQRERRSESRGRDAQGAEEERLRAEGETLREQAELREQLQLPERRVRPLFTSA
jgi:5'-3' exonuclease